MKNGRMRIIELSTWKRRAHFEFFSRLDYPHFNIVVPIDIGRVREHTAANKLSFFKFVLYLVARSVNEIPELRQRIRDRQVVEHDVVHPSYTYLGEDELFGFTHVDFTPDRKEFFQRASRAEQQSKAAASLYDEPGRDDYVFISSLPWLHFSSLSHPIHMHPVDSFPRISWGRYDFREGSWQMPVSLQVHHGLVDGFHVGQFFDHLQEACGTPELLS